MVRARAGFNCMALLCAALALCACFVAARSEKLGAAAGAMDATALKSCLVHVHAKDPEQKLLALGSAWNSMSAPARLGFLKEIRRAERAEDVDDFTLLQISAVESPEFSKQPVGCFSTALEAHPERVWDSFSTDERKMILLELEDVFNSVSKVATSAKMQPPAATP